MIRKKYTKIHKKFHGEDANFPGPIFLGGGGGFQGSIFPRTVFSLLWEYRRIFGTRIGETFMSTYFEDHLQTAASASQVFCKGFLGISYENASFGILEDSACCLFIS